MGAFSTVSSRMSTCSDHRGGGEGVAVGVVDMVDVFFMQVIKVHRPTQTCNLKPLFHGVKVQTFINTDAVPLRCA